MSEQPSPEAVDHPPHYQGRGGIEAIDVIESFGLGFNLGSAVKYVLRCQKKHSTLEDLKKAEWFIRRAIANCKAGKPL